MIDVWFDLERLHDLRGAVAAHAQQMAAPEEQIERLVIVACELATNAIRHGGGVGRLQLWRRGTTVFCRVSDDGPGIADPSVGSDPPDPTDVEGHRGLWICRNLSAELIFERGPDGRGTAVTAVVPALGDASPLRQPVSDGAAG